LHFVNLHVSLFSLTIPIKDGKQRDTGVLKILHAGQYAVIKCESPVRGPWL